MSRTLAEMVAAAGAEAHEVSPAQASEASDHAELHLILDVREP